MSTRYAAVFAPVGQPGQPTVRRVCAELGISRQQFYEYRRRYAKEGVEGLADRTRRPLRNPNQTPAEMVAKIVATRQELDAAGWDAGAWSIFYRLCRRGEDPPHPRTIHRVLVRAGLIDPQPKKRPRSSYRSFEYPAADDLWQLDAFAYALAGGVKVVVFHLTDDCSRYLLAAQAWPAETTEGAWSCVSAAIQRYGLPVRVLTDNSLAFTGRLHQIVVMFEANLGMLGVQTINSTPSHPQTCGKNERAHQTLQKWLAARPPATSIPQLQALLDAFQAAFNQQRPHQAIGGRTPAERRAERTLTNRPGLTPRQPPCQVIIATVSSRGEVDFPTAHRVNLGVEHATKTVSVFITGWPGDQTVTIFWRHYQIHRFSLDPNRRRQPGRRATQRARRTIN